MFNVFCNVTNILENEGKESKQAHSGGTVFVELNCGMPDRQFCAKQNVPTHNSQISYRWKSKQKSEFSQRSFFDICFDYLHKNCHSNPDAQRVAISKAESGSNYCLHLRLM